METTTAQTQASCFITILHILWQSMSGEWSNTGQHSIIIKTLLQIFWW